MEIILIAILLATAKFILMVKFLPIRKVLWFDKWIDLFFTLVLPLMFWGTYSGMATAVLSGLMLSLYLLLARWTIGTQAPDWVVRRRRTQSLSH